MRRSAQIFNLFMKSGQVNIEKRYEDLCREGGINVGYVNSRWIRVNETSQLVNTKDFPIGPSKKWSVGKYIIWYSTHVTSTIPKAGMKVLPEVQYSQLYDLNCVRVRVLWEWSK